MASGEGKRFGSNKLLAELGGVPLLSFALDLSSLFLKRVVVTRSVEVSALCRDRGIDFVLHSKPYRSDTVRLGLEALFSIDACIFLQGDQPLLTKESVKALVLARKNNPDAILRLSYNGKGASPILFPKRYFDELKSLPEGCGGGALLEKHSDNVFEVEALFEQELLDVDTRKDLELLKKHINYK